jgi:hypothetical protein
MNDRRVLVAYSARHATPHRWPNGSPGPGLARWPGRSKPKAKGQITFGRVQGLKTARMIQREPCTYAGWSVVVTGQMRVVTDSAARRIYENSLASPTITSKHRQFLTVTPRLVTGLRRLPTTE